MTTTHYWQHKLSLWLHDPVYKAFDIRRHQSLAEEIAVLLHVASPSKDDYQHADMMASGMTRAALPGYNPDEEQNGAIDFSASPLITHPLVANCQIRLATHGVSVSIMHVALKTLLKNDIGLEKTYEELCALPLKERPLSGHFNWHDSPEEWAKALYFYLYFALKKRLRQENIGGLGGAWALLPADSRMPDHPLWHHLGLTSAIGSALADDPGKNLSLVVFTVTPVQAFISRARKLRDHWVGSVILSYLAFTGIRHIAETIGPDHIVYPSLQDQSLVEAWIGKTFHLEKFLQEMDEDLRKHKKAGESIASFPNKFVFLCATSKVDALCVQIEETIQEEWLRVARLVKTFLAGRLDSGSAMDELFEHQISDYWQFSYAASRLANLNDQAVLGEVLAKEKWQPEHAAVTTFAKIYGQKGQAVARMYGATHSLIQSLLAASKFKPARIRKAQHGEKCPLCGEHEVLHDFSQPGKTGANEYKAAVQLFWQRAREKENSAGSYAQVGKNERICALCTIKRFLPRVLQQKDHQEELLATVLTGAEKFPATTELAAKRYLQKLTNKVTITSDDYPQLIDALHESELDGLDDDGSSAMHTIIAQGREKGVTYTDRDKYYALLLMDGDKMGDLINGKTLTATWGDTIHPELRAKFAEEKFHPGSPLRPILKQKRILNPALHAAISDSLNSFARYGVAPVIDRLGGKLIYAGGDDVCTILPLDAAMEAAETIRKTYSLGFVRYTSEGAVEMDTVDQESTGKMGMHLGCAEGISISGAIVIAHHKAPLREVLRDAHFVLLDLAKNKAGRNALAIRLNKRSGGARDLWFKWNAQNIFRSQSEPLLTSFAMLMQGVTDDFLGGSLLYRLAELKGALLPLVQKPEELHINKEKIIRLIEYEIGHSGKGSREERMAQKRLFAERLAGILIRHAANEPDWFNPESAIIANFLAVPAARREI